MLAIRLIIRNALRHRLRTFLTIAGMTVAILAFGTLRTVVDAWYAGVEASSANRLIVRNAISLLFYLPISYEEKIRQVEGIKTVSYGSWFAGYYIDEKNFFANFAIEQKNYFEMYPEFVLDEKEVSEFRKDRRAAIAGRKLMERFGWKMGDVVTLKGTIFPGDWDFVIKGVYHGRDKKTDETQFFFRWDYLNESLRKTGHERADEVGFYLIEVEDADQAAIVAARIDALFENSLAETYTETEKAFQMGFVSMTEAIMMAIQLVSVVVIIIIMAVMANTMAMSVRERMAEYGVFKTLGFGPGHIILFILGESFAISLFGCALGVAMTFPAADLFYQKLGQYFPIFNVKMTTIYMDIAAAVIVALVAVIIPAYKAIRVPIVDALRRVG